MAPSFPYTAADQMLILSWAHEAGFSLRTKGDEIEIFKNHELFAVVAHFHLFDRLVAEIAQLAAIKVVFHMKEHAFITLKKLQVTTLLGLIGKKEP